MNEVRTSLTREWVVISSLTLVGAVLRLWAFGELGLDHFDEGIYAFSGLWISTVDGPLALDPMVIPYAPCGFPILVGVSYLMFGVSDHSAILAATVCGIATIPIVGWLGRRTFGPGAGAASATFVALSMAHVAFSRKALTDVPFLLVWLVAIGQGSRFLERPTGWRAFALGLCVGVAQEFKYNGWLVGSIPIVAALVGTIRYPEERKPRALLRTYGLGLIAIIVASLVVAPWYRFVETHGGYGALLRHQRNYLGDLTSWPSHWTTQMAEAYALSGSRRWGGMTWVMGWLLGELAANDRQNGFPWPRQKFLNVLLVVGGGACLFTLQANLPWWLGLAWSPWLVLSPQPSRRLVGVWWLIMSIMTPLYHPYARLWLPLHGVGWILLGGGLVGFRPFGNTSSECPLARNELPFESRRPWIRRGVGFVCLTLSLIEVGRSLPNAMPWSWVLQPSRTGSFRSFVIDCLGDEVASKQKLIRVYARRPLAFYLAMYWRGQIQLEPSPGSLSQLEGIEGRAIIDGAMLEHEGMSDAELFRILKGWEIERTVAVEVDPVTLLDIRPQAASQKSPQRRFELWLLSPRKPTGAGLRSGPGQLTIKGHYAP